jgi:hypothetical protein
MAFVAANLALLGSANGFNHFRYDTTDALTAVEVTGYINNEDDEQNIGKGDVIEVFVWSTAVRTGFVTDCGYHVCNDVDANGDVGLSTDQFGTTAFTSTA